MSTADRILESFDLLASTAHARNGLPDARFLAMWSYSVTEATEETFSGRALSALCPQPDLPLIPNMPGIAGTKLKPAVGSIVGVMFLDGNPAAPRVVSWDQTVPVHVGLAGADQAHTVGQAVHRVNDTGVGPIVTATSSVITLTNPDGTTAILTDSSGVSQWVITGTASVGASAAEIRTKATTGSGKVSSG